MNSSGNVLDRKAGTMKTVLRDDVIYNAWDRFVCSQPSCAGMTALLTGESIDGHKLQPVTQADMDEWNSYEDLDGPLQCECGRLAAPKAGA